MMHKLMAIAAGILIALSSTVVAAVPMAAPTSMETQVTKQADEAFAIRMTGDTSGGFKIEGSRLTILRDGFFNISAAAPVGGTGTGDVFMWMPVNGRDVPGSNSQQTIPAATFTAVLVVQTGMELKKNDVVEFIISATAPGLGIIASKPANMPGVPSIIFPIVEL